MRVNPKTSETTEAQQKATSPTSRKMRRLETFPRIPGDIPALCCIQGSDLDPALTSSGLGSAVRAKGPPLSELPSFGVPLSGLR
ncbi:hypothetical protein NL676_024781 [Syzygium grande]|nr:hypothetical protein NL676_024781 [Syzygium grande]